MKRAREIYRVRQAELFIAGGALAMGLFISREPASMVGAPFRAVLDIMPEHVWGLLFALNGVIHLLALYINGSRWWTPIVRIFACLYAASIYGGFAAGFAEVNPNTTAVMTYSTWAALALSCAYKSYLDLLISAKVHHVYH